MENNSLGIILKKARINCGLKLSEAAKKINMKTAQQLNSIESGRAPIPRKYLKRISNIYNVSPKDFRLLLLGNYLVELNKDLGIKE